MLNSIPDIFRVSLPDPTAGINFEYVLPDNFYYKLISFKYRFVTDATAVSRFQTIRVDDAGTPLFWTQLTASIPANQTRDVSICPWGTTPPITSSGQHAMPWPIDIFLKGGWEIQTITVNIQAADQISNIEAAFMRWAVQTV